jgi:hypothetical protein
MKLLILPLIFLSGCMMGKSELNMNHAIMKNKCLEHSMELIDQRTRYTDSNFKYNFVCMSDKAEVKSFTFDYNYKTKAHSKITEVFINE